MEDLEERAAFTGRNNIEINWTTHFETSRKKILIIFAT